jgi:hypothetical protein
MPTSRCVRDGLSRLEGSADEADLDCLGVPEDGSGSHDAEVSQAYDGWRNPELVVVANGG